MIFLKVSFLVVVRLVGRYVDVIHMYKVYMDDDFMVFVSIGFAFFITLYSRWSFFLSVSFLFFFFFFFFFLIYVSVLEYYFGGF